MTRPTAPGLAPDDPRHGTYAGALAHWRAGEKPCHDCRLAARRQRKGAALDAHRGAPRMVRLGEEAIAVINAVPLAQLKAATGIPVHKFSTYRSDGPDRRVHRTTRDRILAAGRRHYWTPIGIQRRLRAISALGWPMRHVAEMTGVDMDTLKKIRSGYNGSSFVCTRTAEGVLAAFEQLSMTLPEPGRGTARTRTHARKSGWLPPLAWTNIDDPNEQPAASHEPRPIGRPRRMEAVLEDFDWLTSQGLSGHEAAKRVGVALPTIDDYRRRLLAADYERDERSAS